MLVSKEPIRIEPEHEPGAWFDVVRLSWKQLKKARRRATLESAEVAQAFGAAFIQQLSSGAPDAEEKALAVLKRQEYDASQFDTETLLRHGLVGWSYPVKVSDDSIGELDEATAAWLKQGIIDLTKPPDEEALKN